jgi:anion-transporting  ArsA/GET3 family ATPase
MSPADGGTADPARPARPPAGPAGHASQRPALLDHRLIFVLGKGGVGRTTVTAALGLLAAQRGARVLVVELAGRSEIPRLLGAGAEVTGDATAELELQPGLFATTAEPTRALEEYLRAQLPLRLLADAIGTNRTVGYLTAATPGLRELLCAGKIWEFAQPVRRAGAAPYDLVIVDAPATGHGIALLAAPQTFAAAARSGPIERHAAKIAATFKDASRTALVAVTTAHETAVTELLELRATLHGELALDLTAIIANAVPPARFDASDAAAMRAARASSPQGAVRTAIDLALASFAASESARAELARLGAAGAPPQVELVCSGAGDLSAAEIAALAVALEVAV